MKELIMGEELLVKRPSRRAPPPPDRAYIIVAEAGVPELVAAVNQKMAAGWQPVGGPLKLGTDWGVAQAMVK